MNEYPSHAFGSFAQIVFLRPNCGRVSASKLSVPSSLSSIYLPFDRCTSWNGEVLVLVQQFLDHSDSCCVLVPFRALGISCIVIRTACDWVRMGRGRIEVSGGPHSRALKGLLLAPIA